MVGLGRAAAAGCGALLAASFLFAVAPAGAHETATFGSLTVTVGWAEEPAFTATANAVEVTVTDAQGTPTVDPAASLAVQVSTGEDRTTLPLTPSDTAGAYEAALLPTRAGTYRFHVTGKVSGTDIDVDVVCSDETFDCVTDPETIAFPRGSSGGELATRLDRVDARVVAARDDASTARRNATLALVVAGLASGVAVGLGLALARSRKDA